KRARIYRGRLSIIQPMILSVLWHFTLHFELPTIMIQRVQSLVEKYLLTRSRKPVRRFLKRAKRSICYIPFEKGGLQIPHIRIMCEQPSRISKISRGIKLGTAVLKKCRKSSNKSLFIKPDGDLSVQVQKRILLWRCFISHI
ncbi:Pol Polyprotein, partial [Phytophthora megakarya]